VPINTVVSLVATPASGSVFAGWSGDTDCGEGQVAMSAARTCTASFQPAVTGDPRMWIDIPGGGAQVQPVRIAGWAIDLAAATGSGVDSVHLWAYPNPGSGTPAIFLGVAWYGGDRPDIAAAFGQDRFRFSGYDLTTSVTLAPNTYQLVVFAHSTVTGTFNQAQTVNIEIRTPTPAQWIDIPGNGAQVGAAFIVAGWAIDLNAPSGVGVDRVDLSAQLNGTGTPIYLGRSATVPARPDIGAYFGSQFLNCAWGITASGLSPGTYLITVSPHNTSIDGHTAPSTVWVTVGQ
jgi:hypothetical protein